MARRCALLGTPNCGGVSAKRQKILARLSFTHIFSVVSLTYPYLQLGSSRKIAFGG